MPRCLLPLFLVACSPTGGQDAVPGAPDTAVPERGASPYSLDHILRLNHVQALGTHNSTHIEPDPVIHPSHAYTHAPLTVQLRDQGVRALELDIHLHVDDGFHVFHLPNVDAETTCLRLADCLGEIRAWSRSNPWHMPLMIWLEPKDEDLDGLVPEYTFFVDRHDELEDALIDGLGRQRIFTPDELRGDHIDLPAALGAEGGWPTLDRMRGRIVLAMLDGGMHAAAYLHDDPALGGRVMFVSSADPSQPYAAVAKINDASGNSDLVARAISAGIVVSSNLRDGAEHDAGTGAAHLAHSLSAGAHFLKSDRPAPVDGWSSSIPEGTPARCNPVTAPAACTPTEVEFLP